MLASFERSPSSRSRKSWSRRLFMLVTGQEEVMLVVEHGKVSSPVTLRPASIFMLYIGYTEEGCDVDWAGGSRRIFSSQLQRRIVVRVGYSGRRAQDILEVLSHDSAMIAPRQRLLLYTRVFTVFLKVSTESRIKR